MRTSRLLVLLLCLSMVSVARPAHVCADPAAARTHFEAGVSAYEEQRLADAAAEFQRAYDASPAWQVLYNLGSVYAALGDPVASVVAFERYLHEADASVSAERRREVQEELARQKKKIGHIHLTVEPAGAEVRVDAKLIGHAPLAQPILVSAGAHVIDVDLQGHHRRRAEVEVSPHSPTVLAWTLKSLETSARSAERPVPLQSPTDGRVMPRREPGTVQRTIGWAIASIGSGTIIAGTVLVAKGQLKHQRAVELATRDESQRDRAEALESRADRQRTVGFSVLGVGGAALLAGVVTVWASPRGTSYAGIRIEPSLSLRAPKLTISARF